MASLDTLSTISAFGDLGNAFFARRDRLEKEQKADNLKLETTKKAEDLLLQKREDLLLKNAKERRDNLTKQFTSSDTSPAVRNLLFKAYTNDADLTERGLNTDFAGFDPNAVTSTGNKDKTAEQRNQVSDDLRLRKNLQTVQAGEASGQTDTIDFQTAKTQLAEREAFKNRADLEKITFKSLDDLSQKQATTFTELEATLANEADANDRLLATIEQADPNDLGKLAGFKEFVGGWLSEFGIDSDFVDNAKDIGVIRKTAMEQVAKSLKSTFGGQLSDSERKFLVDTFASVTDMRDVALAITEYKQFITAKKRDLNRQASLINEDPKNAKKIDRLVRKMSFPKTVKRDGKTFDFYDYKRNFLRTFPETSGSDLVNNWMKAVGKKFKNVSKDKTAFFDEVYGSNETTF